MLTFLLKKLDCLPGKLKVYLEWSCVMTRPYFPSLTALVQLIFVSGTSPVSRNNPNFILVSDDAAQLSVQSSSFVPSMVLNYGYVPVAYISVYTILPKRARSSYSSSS
jgi:hypothetical protein